jgi:integrase
MKEEINYKLVTRLTRELKDAAKRPEKEYEIWDTKLDGFVLRVRPSGKMVYAMFYSRGKKLTIGPADTIDHDQARVKAMEIRTEYDKSKRGDGPDPIEKRQQLKEDETRPATYLRFLNDRYRPWLQINLVHGEYAYTTLVKAFPEFHSLPLNKITPGEIESWRTERLTRGLAPNTINRQLSDLKACLHRARDIWNLEISDKLDRAKPCKIDRSPKVRYLSGDEEKRLREALDKREHDLRNGSIVYALRKGGSFSYASPEELKNRAFADHLKPAVLVSMNTGLRQGELLKLKWEDVDFEQAIVTVIGSTSKTGKTRHIPLNAEASSVLRAWKNQPGVTSVKGYVFPSIDGEPMSEIGKSWEGLLRRAKITSFRWHDLRHHFASRLVMAGVDLNTVRELLGHGDYKMTLRYAHLAPEHKAAAVAKLVSAT